MKPSEIREGRTYRDKHGQRRRVRTLWNLVGKRLVTYVLPDGSLGSITLAAFARRAVEQVPNA